MKKNYLLELSLEQMEQYFREGRIGDAQRNWFLWHWRNSSPRYSDLHIEWEGVDAPPFPENEEICGCVDIHDGVTHEEHIITYRRSKNRKLLKDGRIEAFLKEDYALLLDLLCGAHGISPEYLEENKPPNPKG